MHSSPSLFAKRPRDEDDRTPTPKRSKFLASDSSVLLPERGSEMDVDMSASSEEEDASSSLYAPRMVHHISTNSLSSLSSNQSAPSTPPASHYPSGSNPTSFTDLNGITHSFPPATLSLYPCHGGPEPDDVVDDATAFAAYALQHGYSGGPGAKREGVIKVFDPSSQDAMSVDGNQVRRLDVPSYCWDVPAQAPRNAFLGGHLI